MLLSKLGTQNFMLTLTS